MAVNQRRLEGGGCPKLLAAIAELREAVSGLIEEQKALVLFGVSASEAAGPSPEPKPVAAEVRTTPPLAVPPPKAREAARAPAPSRKPLSRVKVSTPVPPLATPVAGGGAVASEGGPAGKPEDHRQRLDALARLLDKRLRPEPGSPPPSGTT